MNTSSIATVLRSSVLLMILVPLLTAPVLEAQCGNPSGSFQCFQSCYLEDTAIRTSVSLMRAYQDLHVAQLLSMSTTV